MSKRNLRFASLDMKGRLVIDVRAAVAAGVWADEIEAARDLGRMLANKLHADDDPRYTLTPLGESLTGGAK